MSIFLIVQIAVTECRTFIRSRYKIIRVLWAGLNVTMNQNLANICGKLRKQELADWIRYEIHHSVKCQNQTLWRMFEELLSRQEIIIASS